MEDILPIYLSLSALFAVGKVICMYDDARRDIHNEEAALRQRAARYAITLPLWGPLFIPFWLGLRLYRVASEACGRGESD
jgi:hypothetical protein